MVTNKLCIFIMLCAAVALCLTHAVDLPLSF